MSTVYLALGANLGDREAALRGALDLLQDSGQVTARAVSSLYETAPMYVTDQPPFLNAVARVETTLAPDLLLARLKEAEGTLGRVARQRYGPREVDLDILLYDDLVLAGPRLTIPHQRMAERAFVLLPLAELAPRLAVPGMDRTVEALVAMLGPQEQIERYRGRDWYALASEGE